MVPIALDPENLRLAVAGNGSLAIRRLRALRAAGAGDILVFADAPEPDLVEEAQGFLRRRLPDAQDLRALQLLWIAGLPETKALVAAARANRVLVNVEDVPAQCDFHSVAEVRRKNLILTVSTNGAAPGLAGSIRRQLEHCFGPEWDARVDEVAGLRTAWREAGLPMAEIARRIDVLMAERGWLACRKSN